MPVYNSDRQITGCTMLINKLNGCPFNENDANIIEVNTSDFYENTAVVVGSGNFKQSITLMLLESWTVKKNGSYFVHTNYLFIQISRDPIGCAGYSE